MPPVIRVKDLPDQVGTPGRRALLYCPVCQEEYSANRGDYFLSDPETLMCCHVCEEPLELVTKHTLYKPVEVRP